MHRLIWGQYVDRREKKKDQAQENSQHLEVGKGRASIEGPQVSWVFG